MKETKCCINCFKDIDTSIGGGEICPHCGYNNAADAAIKGGLKPYTRLENRYVLGRVKCANAEGFTYAALDNTNHVLVDIREFFPTTIAYRDGQSVFPGEGREAAFAEYYEEFLQMARGLLRLQELNGIVPVQELFWQNNTAYMVYRHFGGVSLKSYMEKKGGRLDWNQVSEQFLPLIHSLSAMHALGIRHLGISPETLRMCKDGKLRLSEFSIEAVRRAGSGLQPDLVVGCPAYEQYTKNMACGEITDVYALAACMLYCLTGALPPGADKRVENERLLIAKDILKILQPHVIQALAAALQVRQENRTGSFERLRAELLEAPTVTNEIQGGNVIKELPRTYQKAPVGRGLPPKVWLVLSFVVTAALLLWLAYYMIQSGKFSLDSLSNAVNKELETSAVEVVKVPDMIGALYTDWREKLKDTAVYNFDIKVEAQEFSDKPEGAILRQTPAPGETVTKGGFVQLVVSRGAEIRKLPTISGMQFPKAQALLEKEGFVVIREEAYNDTMGNGNVLYYGGDFMQGQEYSYGTAVSVVVSLGKQFPNANQKPAE